MSELDILIEAATKNMWDVYDICEVCDYQHHRFMDISNVLERAIADGLYELLLDSLIED